MDVGRRGRPRNEQHDQAILDATLDLVAEQGAAALTIDQVAHRAGVGKATIYRRWSSKEALLLDAWVSIVGAPPAPDTGTLRGDLEAIFAHKFEGRPNEQMQSVYLQLIATAKLDSGVAATFQAFLTERRRPLRTALQRAVTRGELPDEIDLDLVQDMLVAPFIYRWLFTDHQIDPGVAMSLVDVVLAGITAQAAATAR
jgi:AcrR family transcriptional regulator